MLTAVNLKEMEKPVDGAVNLKLHRTATGIRLQFRTLINLLQNPMWLLLLIHNIRTYVINVHI